MITNADAKATKISGMSVNALHAKLTELGYTEGAAIQYMQDAQRGEVAYLLGRETIRYNRTTGKFTLIIPNDTIPADNVVKGMKISHDRTGTFLVDQITTEASGSIRFMTPAGTYHYFGPAEEVEIRSRHVCISQPCPVCGQIDDNTEEIGSEAIPVNTCRETDACMCPDCTGR